MFSPYWVEYAIVSTFEPGDEVRVDIADATNSNFDWHGEYGEVVDVIEDDTGEATGDGRDAPLYRVELDEYDQILDLGQRDLRAPFED